MNRYWRLRLILVAVALVIFALVTGHHRSSQAEEMGRMASSTDELRAMLATYGEVPVIVTLDVPAHEALFGAPVDPVAEIDILSRADEATLATMRREIDRTGDAVLARLAGERISQVKRYDNFPLLAMIVDANALATLAADPAVVRVEPDLISDPLMDDTIPLIRANYNHLLQYTGSGWSIAILDTGVDRFHSALAGKVSAGACYSSNVPAQGASSLCPGGAISSTTLASGGPCAIGIAGCDHGTHVAGISARVAPGATIISMQVFSRFSDSVGNTPCQDSNRTSPCVRSYTSDQVKALDRVFTLNLASTTNVAAVNMSLGGGRFTGPCDNEAGLNNLRIAINQLRNVNVPTVIAAGNSSYRDAMASPACLTPAVSVAASDKNNRVADYSNISPLTTLMAPGSSIVAPVPQGNTPTLQAKNGTSMAAPHVAGAIASIREGRSNASTAQIINMLRTTGPAINDQRTGGFVTLRRLDAWAGLCALITCDPDDLRFISINQTLNGSISPAGDIDNYYFNGTAGQRITLRMNRTSGSIDPYLELFSPTGFRVAFNDNGGGGVNALINGYLLPQNGLYVIRARSVNNFTGNYQISVTADSVPLNPVPRITSLSPPSATATAFGSDFWVAIYGNNFMPESEVRWNGALRAKFYSSASLIYIRVRGSDIGLLPVPPRLAFVTVSNPTPGGGTSNSAAFNITVPFLGESNLLTPESGTSVPAGQKQAFSVEWIAPQDIGTWRDMQYMDTRLRDEQGVTAAWIRVVEQPGTDSFYRLLNNAGELVDEGLPGENRDLVLDDIVTLHLAESTFSGSGLVATMNPVVTFGPAAVGTYNVEFRVDSKSGTDNETNVQDDDVLGTFSVLPAGCTLAVDDVTLNGPATGVVNALYAFNATVTPPAATAPISYTWTPEPESGQGTPGATFRFDHAGEYPIALQVENCGSFAAAVTTLAVSTGTNPDLTITKEGPPVAAAGGEIVYTLTVSNDGATTATDLLVRDVLPAGLTHVSGGTLVGNEVRLNIAELPGFGQTAEVSFTVQAVSGAAGTVIVNDDYRVEAGGFSATGSDPVETYIVDAVAELDPLDETTLAYGNGPLTGIVFPGGSVFDPTLVGYLELGAPTDLGPVWPYAGRSFELVAFAGGEQLQDHRLGEPMQVTLQYTAFAVAGLDLDKLALRYWDGSGWGGDGVSCSTDAAAQEVTCTVNQPLMTRYALVEETPGVYLPVVIR
jgi:uncharacterized repeat protein (TIGR01451 family)